MSEMGKKLVVKLERVCGVGSALRSGPVCFKVWSGPGPGPFWA